MIAIPTRSTPMVCKKWTVVLPVGAPAIGADGTLYVAAGNLYAIQ